MAELRETEYDPWTGETRRWYFEDNGDITCERSVDLTSLIENCKAETLEIKGFNAKHRFHRVASLPPIIIAEILKDHHLYVFSSDPADKKRLEKIIEQEYPAFKTNDSKLWRP